LVLMVSAMMIPWEGEDFGMETSGKSTDVVHAAPGAPTVCTVSRSRHRQALGHSPDPSSFS
jgi:hypothetical protein